MNHNEPRYMMFDYVTATHEIEVEHSKFRRDISGFIVGISIYPIYDSTTDTVTVKYRYLGSL